jgi:Putative zinc-finger
VRLADDLTCKELIELVTAYHEGALSTRDRQRFEEHVVFCAGCASYLDSMRRTIEVTGRLTEDDLLPELQRELLATFRDWRRG